jgi:hypothetical protein
MEEHVITVPLTITKKTLSNEGLDISTEDEKWFNEFTYGVESVSFKPDSTDIDVHYSMEKFLGNSKDTEAPAAGKM